MHVKPGQVFRPIGVLNTFTELRHSKVKYKFVFYKVSSPPSPSSLLKLPHMTSLARLAIELIYGWLCNSLALIERLKRNSQMGLVFSQSVGDPIQRVVFCFERYHCTAWMLLVT